jgi:hypothetical protein
MTLTKDDSVAVHEAGHAVISVIYGRNLEYVTIIPKDIALGYCCYGEDTPDGVAGIKALKISMGLLAGVAAEAIILDISPKDSRGKNDFDEAEKIFDAAKNGLGKECCDDAARLVWNLIRTPLAHRQIVAVAEELKKHKTLSGLRVAAIMKSVADAQ